MGEARLPDSIDRLAPTIRAESPRGDPGRERKRPSPPDFERGYVRHTPAAAQIQLHLRGTGTPDARVDPSPLSYSDGGGAFGRPSPNGATRLLRSDRSRRGTIVCDATGARD